MSPLREIFGCTTVHPYVSTRADARAYNNLSDTREFPPQNVIIFITTPSRRRGLTWSFIKFLHAIPLTRSDMELH